MVRPLPILQMPEKEIQIQIWRFVGNSHAFTFLNRIDSFLDRSELSRLAAATEEI